MANVTLEPGYLPECSGLEAADFNELRAASFDPRKTSYYIDLWHTVIPAIVFGSLAFIGLVFFIFWMCYQHRRAKRSAKVQRANAAKAQFVTSPGEQPPAAVSAPPHPTPQPAGWRRWATWGWALKLSIIVLSLGLIGVSGWGMARSIEASNDTITGFWELLDAAEVKLANASDTLWVLDEQMGNLSYALGVSSSVVQNVPPLVMLIPGVKDVVQVLQTKPKEAQQLIDGLRGDVQGAAEGINNAGIGTINNIRNNFYWWTSELESTWRFVVIAVVFGLTILFAALAAVLVVWMGWPKTGSLSTALLWLIVVVLMFLGVGLFKGAYQVSEDACLYAESFALRVVNETVTPESTRDMVLKAMNYYFGFLYIPDELVVYELFGAPTHTVVEIVEGPLVQAVLDVIGSGSGVITTVANAIGISPEDSATILGMVDLVPEIVDTVNELDRQANRANIEPLYVAGKEWICCDLKSTLNDIWEAWTIAGCIGWALGALCSARVILNTLEVRRAAVSTAPPGAPAPASPGDMEKGTPSVPALPPPEATDSPLPPGPEAVSIELPKV